MTLYEMSFTYEESADILQKKIADLRRAAAGAKTETERLGYRNRIAGLEPIYREMRELQNYTRHYYDRKERP